MFLPSLVKNRQRATSLTAFGGYRHDARAGAARFYDMENLSADAFPLLKTRARRVHKAALDAPFGLHAGPDGTLMWVDGAQLFYAGEAVGAVEAGPKQFANMGAYVVIWPDKLRFHTQTRTLESLEAAYESVGEVRFSMCSLLGEEYGDYSVGEIPPSTPESGALWLDTGRIPNVLRRHSSATGLWTELAASYIRIGAAGIGKQFSLYDGVRIEGAAAEALNTEAVIYGLEEDCLLVAGSLEAAFSQDTPLRVLREAPDFDYICEKDNRIWGCSSARREIACCKLGDARNWRCFMGLSTDSYVLSAGGGGNFTGCCAYGGNVLFFQADRLMKIMGTKPSNFQLNSTLLHGPAGGAAGSIAQAGGQLYYLARTGVCAYGGALPHAVGEDLGEGFRAGVGGAVGDKYYLSARHESGAWSLFVYDTRCSLWHREDATEALAIVESGGRGYMLTAEGALLALAQAPGDAAEDREARLPWFLETGELIEAGHARAQRLLIRAMAAAETDIEAFLSYDGGAFEPAGHMHISRKQPVALPLRLRRCDSLRLRLAGEGDFELHGLKFIVEEAGD